MITISALLVFKLCEIAHALPTDTFGEHVNSIQHCCKATQAFECISTTQGNNASNVLIMSSKTSEVLGSEGYSISINAAYALYNHYAINILPINEGDGWGKVESLSHRLHLKYNESYKYDVVVWLDPDVIVVDMATRIDILLQEHDIMLVGTSNHHSDTFLIIKNTEWSREFMQIWQAYDHEEYTAEESFNREIRSGIAHIAILPPQNLRKSSIVFNDRSSVTSPFVDMTLEDNIFRYLSFRAAWETICDHFRAAISDRATCTNDAEGTVCSENATSSGSSSTLIPPPPPLGLTSYQLEVIGTRVLSTKQQTLIALLDTAKTAMMEPMWSDFWEVEDLFQKARGIIESGQGYFADSSLPKGEALAMEMAIRELQVELLVLCYTGLRDSVLVELSAVEGQHIPNDDLDELRDMVLIAVDVGMHAVEACQHDDQRVSMRSQLMFEIYANILPTLRGILEINENKEQALAEFRALTLKADLHMKRGEVETFGLAVQGAATAWNEVKSLHNDTPIPAASLTRAGVFFVDAGKQWCDIGRRDDGAQSISIGMSAILALLKDAYSDQDTRLVSALQLDLAKALMASGVCAFNLYTSRISQLIEIEFDEDEVNKIYSLSEEHLTKALRIYENWKGQVEENHATGVYASKVNDRLIGEARKYLLKLRKAKQRASGEFVQDDREDDESADVVKRSAPKKKYMKRKVQ